MSDAAVLTEASGHTLIVTINRPSAGNAINSAVGYGLAAAMQEALESDDLRSVVLTGAGDRTFCAGMDLKAFLKGEDLSGFGAGIKALRSSPKPIIAAVNGACLAGGFELMMDCDLVVAVDDARFGIPEVKRGLFAAGGGTRLPLRLPLAVALELGLTGDPITAVDALRWGLINRSVQRSELLGTALELAERIAANGPLAVSATKELMRGELAAAEDNEQRMKVLQAQVFGSADATEGATAFAERRTPQWQGR